MAKPKTLALSGLWRATRTTSCVLVTTALAILGTSALLGQGIVPAPPVTFTGASAAPNNIWNYGDLFIGVSGGQYQVRDPAGVLKETLSTGGTMFTLGCAFDSAQNLYVTELYESVVSRFAGPTPPHTNTLFGGGYSFPTSIVFDRAGNVYVGNVHNGILQFAPDGTFIRTVINTRVDSFDIAADQNTILYTQQSHDIKTVSISTGLPGANFTTGTATQAVSIRILPDGGALLTDLSLTGIGGEVKRYNAAGVVIATYNVSGEYPFWYALSLDPDGKSFWAGNYGSSNYYKFNIATGGVDTQIAGPFNTGTGPGTLLGICLLAATPTSPTNKDQCMNGGWKVLVRADGTPFKNQGDCIQYVNTGK